VSARRWEEVGIPACDALLLQLAAIAGNEPESSFIEIRPLSAGGRSVGRERSFVPVRELHKAMAKIASLSSTLNALVGCAPRVRREGTAKAVERVWCLWADLDNPVAVAALAMFTPEPTIVIRSGSGENLHAYWALHEAVPAAWARRANRRLAVALGADKAATDPARLLRPAGTLNHKHSPPTRVVCVRLELDVFRIAEVVGALPDAPEYLPQRPTVSPRRATGPRTLDGLARAVRDAQQGNRNNTLYWAARRAYEHVDAGAADEREAHDVLRGAALAAGLDEPRIDATLRSAMSRTVPA
jgi:hypothetical protein